MHNTKPVFAPLKPEEDFGSRIVLDPSGLTLHFVPGGKVFPFSVKLPSALLTISALAGMLRDPSWLGDVPAGSLTFPTKTDPSFSIWTFGGKGTMARDPSVLVMTSYPAGNSFPFTLTLPSAPLDILQPFGSLIEPSMLPVEPLGSLTSPKLRVPSGLALIFLFDSELTMESEPSEFFTTAVPGGSFLPSTRVTPSGPVETLVLAASDIEPSTF